MTSGSASTSDSSPIHEAENDREYDVQPIVEVTVERCASSAAGHSRKGSGHIYMLEHTKKSVGKEDKCKNGVPIAENWEDFGSASQDSAYSIDEGDTKPPASIDHELNSNSITRAYSNSSTFSDVGQVTFFEEDKKSHLHKPRKSSGHRSVKKTEFLKNSVRGKIRREAALSFDNVKTAELDTSLFLMKVAERQKTIKLATCEQIGFEQEEVCFEEFSDDELSQDTDEEGSHDNIDAVSLEIEEGDSCIENNGHVVLLDVMSLNRKSISTSRDCSIESSISSLDGVLELGPGSVEESRTKAAAVLPAKNADDSDDNSKNLSEKTHDSLCTSNFDEFQPKGSSEGLVIGCSQHFPAEHSSRACSFDSAADALTTSCTQGGTAGSVKVDKCQDKNPSRFPSNSPGKACARVDTNLSSECLWLKTNFSKLHVSTKRPPTRSDTDCFDLDTSDSDLKDENSDVYSDDNFDQRLLEKKRRRILSDSIYRRKLSRSSSLPFSRSDSKWQSISQLIKNVESHSNFSHPPQVPAFLCLQPSSRSTMFSESNRIHLSKLQASLKLSNTQSLSSTVLFQHTYDD